MSSFSFIATLPSSLGVNNYTQGPSGDGRVKTLDGSSPAQLLTWKKWKITLTWWQEEALLASPVQNT